jgi:hypothetical protein
MIYCSGCDYQKMPKMEMVHNHEHWRKSHFSFLLLFYFSCVLLFAGYEDWYVALHGVSALSLGVGDGVLIM